MPETPKLTDEKALHRNRARASDRFLQTFAARSLQDRLSLVNKTFDAPAVVTPFPDVWQDFPATLVADADVLDLQPEAHDLIIHSLCLHWANDPVGQLIQCRRALRPDGLLLAAMAGGQTLAELRACLAEAEIGQSGGLSPRILPMADIRDVGGLLQRAGLALPVADTETLTLEYRDARHLMHDLRAMGEANALDGRLRMPTRPSIMRKTIETYQDMHQLADGRVPATFEIITLTGWAPAPDQPKALRPGSATNRLAEALGAREITLKD
jgi:SAM-dependent methyltransferase